MAEISVIMGVLCTRERIPLLARALRSVLEQTYSNFEIIICDDGSDEEARAYLDDLSQACEKVRVVRGSGSSALPVKLNFCLRYAQGRYIARMDDDDLSYPERFDRQLRYLSKHPEISFVGCSAYVISDGEKLGVYDFREFPTARDFRFTQPFIHPTLIFTREAIDEAGGYSEDDSCLLCEDYDLLLRLYAVGRTGANVQELLFEYSVMLDDPRRRKLRIRRNEIITRFRRFRDNRMLPKYLLYVLKPLAVWLIPHRLLIKIKTRRLKKTML